MFRKWKDQMRAGLLALPLALLLSACAVPDAQMQQSQEPVQQTLQLIEEDTAKTREESSDGASIADEAEESAVTEAAEADAGTEDAPAALIDENGVYDQKDDVALYLVTYHHLPSNYITKKEAQKLGWEGGSLEDYAPGCSIGGDYFGNYEGLLPEDVDYHECDIDATGRKRGAKRIIYSEDWKIYYTDDHYDSFEQLY